jgi:FkbM family methyltransferase
MLAKLGSDYGGWVVPTEIIRPKMVCYCGGVGEDISFDLALINRFGCTVHAFDPTPRSIAYVGRLVPKENFHFYPYGLWNEARILKFFAPQNPNHVSHSIKNIQDTSEYFEAICKPISEILVELGHDHLDLLKIDIEGAEFEVIEDLVAHNICPLIMCVEFHPSVSPFRISGAIRNLKGLGLELSAIDDWNLTFLRQEQ